MEDLFTRETLIKIETQQDFLKDGIIGNENFDK